MVALGKQGGEVLTWSKAAPFGNHGSRAHFAAGVFSGVVVVVVVELVQSGPVEILAVLPLH